jgi:hypothetical protein
MRNVPLHSNLGGGRDSMVLFCKVLHPSMSPKALVKGMVPTKVEGPCTLATTHLRGPNPRAKPLQCTPEEI